ncbi:hypothetical protein HDIA_0723 [Hartmannibacter diazotrophicus]|uniref:Uncharacterized protein n=1 Tax=Hartmannibacter diazotrophicus TaxID=1482074 RepID=A0A2C9D205_9HYPH|nr:hypothetical protein [Hartmannibacter diazotrophicus]SON54264.1 hypothetical protein HDIA_0723 [Hartmannibacter diazotrophicus]
MKYSIYLPATQRRVSVGAYVKGVKSAITNPDQVFRHGLETWWPVTGAHIREEFRRGMVDRINRHLPEHGKGRKRTPEWQLQAWRIADKVNNRIVAYERDCPRELRARLANRLES